MKSRRTLTRIPIRLEVILRYERDTWTTTSKNMSAGGFLLDHDDQHPLPLGAVVELQVESPYDPPATRARVVRVGDGEVALQFV